MLFDPIPDLVDPESLADVNLMSLAQAIGLTAGEVTVTVDPTQVKPIRIRAAGQASYNSNARRTLEDMILALSDVCAPFTVEYLKAKVRPDSTIWPLDLRTFISTLHRIYYAAQKHDCVAGDFFMLDLDASLLPGPKREIEPEIVFGLTGHDGSDPEKRQAANEYRATVESLWTGLVRGCLGQWLRDNGVHEFRLSAEIYVEPRRALAIGQPISEPNAPAA